MARGGAAAGRVTRSRGARAARDRERRRTARRRSRRATTARIRVRRITVYRTRQAWVRPHRCPDGCCRGRGRSTRLRPTGGAFPRCRRVGDSGPLLGVGETATRCAQARHDAPPQPGEERDGSTATPRLEQVVRPVRDLDRACCMTACCHARPSPSAPRKNPPAFHPSCEISPPLRTPAATAPPAPLRSRRARSRSSSRSHRARAAARSCRGSSIR